MNDFIQKWNEDYLTNPVAPLGLIAMPGCEELGEKINGYLMKWHNEQQEKSQEEQAADATGLNASRRENVDTPLYSALGAGRKSFLIDVKCPRFGNGEGKAMISSTVRGYDIYILVDIGAYNVTYKMYGNSVPMSPDDHFSDLKRVIAAIGGRAYRLNVIMPMLYEGRQHRRTSRESLDCALALQSLEQMGVSNIITFDAHDPRICNAIPLIGFDSVMPSYQILKALLRKEKDLKLDAEHMMIVSPDEGALDRNIYYSSVMGIPMGMSYKRRDYTQIKDGRNPIIAHEYLGDSVKDKDVFISDDILASGDSVLEMASEMKKRGANRIFAAVTFPLFTSGIEKFNKAYADGLIYRVISTNLTYRSPELKEATWFIEADMSKYISYILASLNHDRSLSGLLNPYDRIKALLEKYK